MAVDRESKLIDAESVLFGLIRNGDTAYDEALNNYLYVNTFLSDSRVSERIEALLVFCHMACRYAVSGGLSPAAAFSICKDYTASIGPAPTYENAIEIISSITGAYVRHVHSLKEINGLSDDIQLCINYIDNNLNKKIRASDLAALTGVKEYSITRRFMLDTGSTVNDYIKSARVDRAKVLLSGTDMRIQEISSALGFSTPSYFSTCFKEVTGSSPDVYRAENRRKT